MIVDDSRAMRTFIRRVIDLSGLAVTECIEACNGRDAIDKLREQKIDAVLSDINMPEMDGEEMLRSLSQDEQLRKIPVIIVSTDASSNRMEQMKALGARGYLGKPFRPEELRDAVEESIGTTHD
ncbi:MAG TPA: response regulator [Bryobacteraceae bacterium]|nr:response regulator [Bryobacteraceae bacterium]